MNTKRIKGQYRQGDVLIEEMAQIPEGLKRVEGRIILAHGEATGHHHSLDIDAADWWKSGNGQEQFIDVAVSAEVTHQEHSPIKLTPGKFRVTRQREYSPEAVRNVAD